MGTDSNLVLIGEKTHGMRHNLCLARLGRKYTLQELVDGEYILTDEETLWSRVNKIEKCMKQRIAFLVGYTPKTVDEAEIMLVDLGLDIANTVEELVHYGRKILLANILSDGAGFLQLEDS